MVGQFLLLCAAGAGIFFLCARVCFLYGSRKKEVE